ncbi:MAG: hypothetical protein A2V66_02920 [Ignavibacteria bacterium RBG_13_36_8]|nr:MAG: hypothetical protein A2V66_02920 [Ignavibacteria bacterium RBG_13_36_8]
MKKIGLALGAGGARGLAHIVFLEAFEELGIKPSVISGTSIGAIIGAVYAAGISAKEMKEAVNEIVFSKKTKFWEIHKKSDIIKMFNFIDPDYHVGGMIKGEKFVKFLFEHMRIDKFEDLQIPLKIIATNYWNKEEVILEKGNLLQAIRASFSLPGLFSPVDINGTLLMDGGMVNPLPYDILKDDCDITAAIDVSAKKVKTEESTPPAYEILFSAFQIMQNSIVQEKFKQSQPDILIKTNIQDVRIHEFTKAASIFEQVLTSKDELKREIEKHLNNC